jgi:ABC-2 type transport system permease protein
MAVIAAKDLLQRSRDRSAYVMGLVAPLGLVFILNSTLGSVDESITFDFGLVVTDGGEIAAGFEDALASLEAEGIVAVHRLGDRDALDEAVARGELPAGFAVEEGFSAAVRSGEPSQITVVGDPSASLSVGVARSIAESYAHEVSSLTIAVASIQAAGLVVDDPGQLAATGGEAPITLIAERTEGRGYDAASYYAISLSVFFLFFTVQFGLLSLLEEREVGTLNRLLASPIPAGAVLAGKLGSSFVLGVATMAILVVATTVVVGATWGNWLAVAVLIVAGVLTAIAFASLAAGVARTAEQAGTYGSLIATVLGLLGGAFFPLSEAPGYLNAVSYLSPHRWLLESLRDVSYGAGVGELGTALGVLGAFIVVAGGVGLASAGRRLVP